MKIKPVKYIEYLLKRKFFPDFHKAMGYKTDLKEWTECVGMLHRVMQVTKGVHIDLAFDIGCGKRPTLGAMMAYNVKSLKYIFSIDPELDTTLAKDVKKLKCMQSTLHYFLTLYKPDPKLKTILVCCNHAHVSTDEIKELFKLADNYIYITNPCCVDNLLDKGEYYRDQHIWSKVNEIYTFKKGVL